MLKALLIGLAIGAVMGFISALLKKR